MVATFVGSFLKNNVVGNQDIPLPAGCPDLTTAEPGTWAIHFWTTTYNVAAGTWQAHVNAFNGFAANGGGVISEGSAWIGSQNGVNPSNTAGRMSNKAISMGDMAGTSASDEATFVGFPSAGNMRINWTAVGAGWTSAPILFTIYTGLKNAKVVNWTTPSAVGLKKVPVGFSPDYVMHASAWINSANALPYTGTHGFWGFGVMNKDGQQWANATVHADGSTPNTSFFEQTDSCLIEVSGNDTPSSQMQFYEMYEGGFIVNMTLSDTAARHVVSLCMDGIVTKIGAFQTPAAGTSQVVPTRHGFTAKGAMFSNVAQATQGVPGANGCWGFGATDFTNRRAAVFGDHDAQAASHAKGYWTNGYDFALLYSFGSGSPVERAMTVTAQTAEQMTMTFSAAMGGAYEILYVIVGDDENVVYPKKIPPAFDTEYVASSSSTATSFSNQKKVAVLSNRLNVGVVAVGSAYAVFYRWFNDEEPESFSMDSDIAGWANGSIDSYVDSGGTERLVAVWKQSGTGGGRADTATYVMVGTFNAEKTKITWGAAAEVYPAPAPARAQHIDVVAHAEGTGGVAHFVGGDASSSPTAYALYKRIDIAGAVCTVGAQVILGGDYATGVNTFPSIDIDPTTKRLMVVWSAGSSGVGKGIRFRSAAYAAGAWTWGTETGLQNSLWVNDTTRWLVVRFDPVSGKAMVVGFTWTGSNFYQNIIEVDPVALTFTSRLERLYAGSAETLWNFGSATLDHLGNIHIVCHNNVTTAIQRHIWVRATLTLGTVIEEGPNLGATVNPYSWYSEGRVHWIYTAGNNSPYNIMVDRLVVSMPPTVVLTAPADDAILPQTGNISLGYTVTDPDSGDTVQKIAVRRRRLL